MSCLHHPQSDFRVNQIRTGYLLRWLRTRPRRICWNAYLYYTRILVKCGADKCKGLYTISETISYKDSKMRWIKRVRSALVGSGHRRGHWIRAYINRRHVADNSTITAVDSSVDGSRELPSTTGAVALTSSRLSEKSHNLSEYLWV